MHPLLEIYTLGFFALLFALGNRNFLRQIVILMTKTDNPTTSDWNNASSFVFLGLLALSPLLVGTLLYFWVYRNETFQVHLNVTW
jgi:hypothetical protein